VENTPGEWASAKSFLAKIYPSAPIADSKIPHLIKLIEADIVRVQDPDVHTASELVSGINYIGNRDNGAIKVAIAELSTFVAANLPTP